MNWRHIIGLSASAALGFLLLPYGAVGQQKSIKDQIVGTWSLVSQSQTRKDGSIGYPSGMNPKGVNMFTADGQFVLLFMRGDLPKVAGGNRGKATADEAMAIARGSIGYFGSYTVDEPAKTLILRIQGSTFANQIGVAQKRVISLLTTDELKYRNTGPISGGFIEVAFKRAK
ncbi:MAG: lipocalin-like domain-containing protein [Xanthobacteraceae bacterium]